MRVALFALGVMTAVWLLSAAGRDESPAPPPRPPAVVARELHDCRDQCEQRGIVEQLDEAVVKACQARCQGTPAPREPITRITVAPVDHRTTILDERRGAGPSGVGARPRGR